MAWGSHPAWHQTQTARDSSKGAAHTSWQDWLRRALTWKVKWVLGYDWVAEPALHDTQTAPHQFSYAYGTSEPSEKIWHKAELQSRRGLLRKPKGTWNITVPVMKKNRKRKNLPIQRDSRNYGLNNDVFYLLPDGITVNSFLIQIVPKCLQCPAEIEREHVHTSMSPISHVNSSLPYLEGEGSTMLCLPGWLKVHLVSFLLKEWDHTQATAIKPSKLQKWDHRLTQCPEQQNMHYSHVLVSAGVWRCGSMLI